MSVAVAVKLLAEPSVQSSDRKSPGAQVEQRSKDYRLNVRLSRKASEALDYIARELDVTAVEAIRHAIGTEKFFLNNIRRGAKIYLELPGEKNLKEVVFPEKE